MAIAAMRSSELRTPRTNAFGSAASAMVGGSRPSSRSGSSDLTYTPRHNGSLGFGSSALPRPDKSSPRPDSRPVTGSAAADLSSTGYRASPSAGGRSRPPTLRSPAASIDTASTSAGFSLVRAMKGTPMAGESEGKKERHAASTDSITSEGEDSDGNRSVCSARSNRSDVSALSTMSSSQRGGPRKGSSASNGSNRSIHMSFSGGSDSGPSGECSIDIEQQTSLDPSKMSLCSEFSQLVGEGQADGLMSGLEMYGYQKPNKLQQHVLPAVLHFLGKAMQGGQSSTTSGTKGKSCMIIQGPEKSGKTSAAILSLLVSIDFSLYQPQAILLSASPKRDFDKFLSVFTLMQSINYQSFWEEDDAEIDQNSPKVKAARSAHILIGHPRLMLKLLNFAPNVNFDAVKALVIDDAEELLYNTNAPPSPMSQAVRAAVAGQVLAPPAKSPSPPETRNGSKEGREGRRQRDEAATATLSAMSEKDAGAPESKTLSSCLQSPHVEDIVQICNVLECRQYSYSTMDSYRISSGQAAANKLRYIILSQQLIDPASRKVLRLLKNSLMKKKNLLGMDGMPPPTRIIKAMKHYYAEAPASDWVRVFAGLVQSLMFPRALIFCDDQGISQFAKEMQDMGIAVSVNLPASGADAASVSEARRRAVQDFTSNKTQFLLTRSEPAVCQIVLPKVSCVFHFGIPSNLPSVYGVRLLPLDPGTAKDAASILFIDAPRDASGNKNSLAKNIGKLFDIDFLDMPFEFLPAQAAGTSRRSAAGRKR